MPPNKLNKDLQDKIQKAASLADEFTRPLKALNHPMFKRLAAIQKMSERFQHPFLKQIRDAQKIVHPYHNFMAQHYPQILSAAQLGQKIMARTLPAIQRWREAIEERVEAYPGIKPKIKALADNGWFLSSDYVLSWRLDEFVDPDLEGDALYVHMETHYKNNFNDFVDALTAHYPDRSEILNQAAQAHREGKYYLSINAFLAQADGIANKEFGRYVFQGKHGEGNIAAEKPALENEEDLLEITQDIFWASFDEKPPIAQNVKERGKSGYTGLNRHTILHGDETDYGTEINSLKSFSLLCHIHTLTHFKGDAGE